VASYLCLSCGRRWQELPRGWRTTCPRCPSKYMRWLNWEAFWRSPERSVAFRKVHRTDLTELVSRNTALEAKYRALFDDGQNEELERAIDELETEAAAIIARRTAEGLDPIERRLAEAVQVAEDLLGNGEGTAGEDLVRMARR
jgi:hypothetical protein